MSPDGSMVAMLKHSASLARRVFAGEIHAPSVYGLMESLSRHYCDVSCRETQLASAMLNYQRLLEAKT